MGYINPRVLDRGLACILADATRMIITEAEPSPPDYSTAVAAMLGEKVLHGHLTGPYAAISGRRVTMAAITDGMVVAAGTAAYWSLLDDTGERLLACSGMSNSAHVEPGNVFTLDTFDIQLPGVA